MHVIPTTFAGALMIVTDERNPRAAALRDAISSRLGPLPEKLVLVIGGDGFLLQTVHNHGTDRTYLGLNAGTLGFLLNDAEDLDKVVTAINERRLQAWDFPMLSGVAHTTEGQHLPLRAVNDIYLERSTGQTARLELALEDHVVVDALVSDGMIFSTALGSTGYAFSAGATVCHPTLSTFTVTPICPHRPRLPPITLPSGSTARVTVHAPDRRPVRAVADGREVAEVLSVEVAMADDQLSMAYFEDHDFTARMIALLLRS